MENEFKIIDGTLEKYIGNGMDIVIPQGVTTIGKKAFSGNLYIKTVTTNAELTNIDDYAFQDCESLREVKLSDNVKRIGYATFEGCHNLTKINIPDTLDEIGIGAFDIICAISSKETMNKIRDIQEATEDRMMDMALPMLKMISKEFRGSGLQYEAYPAGDKMIIDLPESEFFSSLELPFIKNFDNPQMTDSGENLSGENLIEDCIEKLREFIKKEKTIV